MSDVGKVKRLSLKFFVVLVHGKLNDETVQELEGLKAILGEAAKSDGKEISISNSQTSFFSDLNGQKSAHKEISNEVGRDGKLLAKVAQKIDMIKDREGKPKSVTTTEVEVPSKGIHKVILKNGENPDNSSPSSKRTEGSNAGSFGTGIDKINSLSKTDYSPLDMAEYIFWTGDEKGVALTIEEFLEEGLMSRQEAINFLQSIKFNLDFMQAHYQGLQKMDAKERNLKTETMNQNKFKPRLYEELHDKKLIPYDVTRPKAEGFELLSKPKQNSYDERLSQGGNDDSDSDFLDKIDKKRTEMKSLKKFINGITVDNDDYEEILERLRVADFLYKEYSLEEVIFQLAKVMFSQSLTRGSKEAENALQKFTSFLQKEVKHGQISKSLERKILDVLITALIDTLTEHPELLAAAKEELQSMADPNSPTSVMLKQLLIPGEEGSLIGQSNLKDGLPEKEKLSGKEKFSVGSFKKVE